MSKIEIKSQIEFFKKTKLNTNIIKMKLFNNLYRKIKLAFRPRKDQALI